MTVMKLMSVEEVCLRSFLSCLFTVTFLFTFLNRFDFGTYVALVNVDNFD